MPCWRRWGRQGRKVKGQADEDIGLYMGWSLLEEKSRWRAAQGQGQPSQDLLGIQKSRTISLWPG